MRRKKYDSIDFWELLEPTIKKSDTINPCDGLDITVEKDKEVDLSNPIFNKKIPPTKKLDISGDKFIINDAKKQPEFIYEDIKIIANLNAESTYILDSQSKIILRREFRGERKSTGEKSADYSRREAKIVRANILKKQLRQLKKESKGEKISEKDKQKLKKLIKSNIDINIYNTLKDYDRLKENYLKTNKAREYIRIMSKDYERIENETNKQYKKRIAHQRMRELEESGIQIKYDMSKGLIFSSVNIFDRIKLVKNAIMAKKNMNANVKGLELFNIKSPKLLKSASTQIKDTVNSLSDKKENVMRAVTSASAIIKDSIEQLPNKKENIIKSITDTSMKMKDVAKGLSDKKQKFTAKFSKQLKDRINERRRLNKLEKIEEQKRQKKLAKSYRKYPKLKAVREAEKARILKQKREQRKELINTFMLKQRKRLAAAGIAGIAIIGAIGSVQYKNILENNDNQKIESVDNKTTNKDNNINLANEINIKNIKIGFKEALKVNGKISEMQNNKVSSKTEMLQEVTPESAEIVINDVKNKKNDLEIGSIVSKPQSGEFYETEYGEGKNGNYENIQGETMKINLIAAIDKEGKSHIFDKEDGLTLNQIKEKYPEAKIVYHFENLGWNEEGKNNIEDNLIQDEEMEL